MALSSSPPPPSGSTRPPAAVPATLSSPRALMLERAAVDAGQSWAESYRVELASEGRPVEGGWPGTMPEARARMDLRLSKLLSSSAMSALTHDERDRLARTTYDEARRSWRTLSTTKTSSEPKSTR